MNILLPNLRISFVFIAKKVNNHVCFIFILLLFTTTAFSQLINKSTKQIEKLFLELNERSGKYIIQEKVNNKIIITSVDTSATKINYEFTFDEKDKCIKEIVSFSCDSCFQKYVAYYLKNDNWDKISEEEYITQVFRKKMAMYLPANNKHTIIFTKLNESRKRIKRRAADLKVYSIKNDSSKYIIWNVNKPLTWRNFKVVPYNSNKNFLATTSSSIYFDIKNAWVENGIQKIEVDIAAVFLPQKSLVMDYLPSNTNPQQLLVHEQLHFDITELFARMLRKQIKEYSFSIENYPNEIDRLYSDILEQKDKMQKKYDNEIIENGDNLIKWLRYVYNLLIDLQEFERK